MGGEGGNADGERGSGGYEHRRSRWCGVGGSWVAAEYGVIGEISRGSSTAANARISDVLSPHRSPLSLSLSLSLSFSG